MMGTTSKTAIYCLSLLMLPCSGQPQQRKGGSDIRASLRAFVQDFYNWYVPKALGDNPFPASEFVLKYRKSALSPELFRALKEDSEAQAKSSDIVGLDWDPFLDSQDPCERYVAGGSTQKGNEYSVKVYAACSGKEGDQPVVIAELVQDGGQWRFINFLYPDQMEHFPESADLLSNLKMLKDEREKPPKSQLKTKN